MGRPPVRGDNPRALASGLSYVQVYKHGITILYHLYQCRPLQSLYNSSDRYAVRLQAIQPLLKFPYLFSLINDEKN